MKFKTRIFITFFSIIILPLTLTFLSYIAISVRIMNVEHGYGLSDMDYNNMVSDTAENYEQVTNDIYHKIWQQILLGQADLDNVYYYEELTKELKSDNSYLIVRKGDQLFYTNNQADAEEMFSRLPAYGSSDQDQDTGFYYNGNRNLVKQIDFKFNDGSQGSIFIVTKIVGIISKKLLLDMAIAIVVIMVFTSLMLTQWMQKGVFTPVNELNIAMQQIADGNLDYQLPVSENCDNEISEIYKNYEDMRLRLKESTEEKFEQEKQNKELISNISHDLKTPITAIKGYVEGIIDGVADTPEKQEKYIRTIYNKANDMDKLINELTTYSKFDNNRIPYNFHKLNVADYFRDCVEEVGLDLESKNITLNYSNIVDPDTMVIADPEQMKRVINNIIGNSVKYMDKKKEKGIIDIRILDQVDSIQVEIEDNGKGIAQKDLVNIFERFYRTDSSRNSSTGGSGIGLSLVQRLIELHHGRIELDSEENKGSTFSVYLPQDLSVYKPSELASNNEQNEEEQVYSTNSKAMYFIDTEKVENESVESGDKKRGTILIVEDNNEIRRYLSNGLADLFNTLEAGNGEEALEKLKDNEVDVIVTDVMMPVMDGIKLCKNVKQNIRTCHIPVIILSAKTDIKDQMEGLQMGADDYIPKPFSLAILTTKIQNMMRTRRRMLDKYAKSLEVEPEKITFNAMDEALLKRAMAIVEKNMDNIEFSTDEFAREMNMSRSNLHLKLKAITGESTIDFIRKIRFNEAAKLLKDGRYTVAEVSTMVGFNTPSYFATSFKKYFGCLPTEYIKKSKG